MPKGILVQGQPCFDTPSPADSPLQQPPRSAVPQPPVSRLPLDTMYALATAQCAAAPNARLSSSRSRALAGRAAATAAPVFFTSRHARRVVVVRAQGECGQGARTLAGLAWVVAAAALAAGGCRLRAQALRGQPTPPAVRHHALLTCS